jgi:hypothetical protein
MVIGAQGNETFIRLAEILSAVFSGHSQRLQDNFEIYFTQGGAGWEMGLFPLDKAVASFAERITIAGDTVMGAIAIYEQNGDRITYQLSNQHFKAELSGDEKAFFTVP